jgi:hypothetical protein
MGGSERNDGAGKGGKGGPLTMDAVDKGQGAKRAESPADLNQLGSPPLGHPQVVPRLREPHSSRGVRLEPNLPEPKPPAWLERAERACEGERPPIQPLHLYPALARALICSFALAFIFCLLLVFGGAASNLRQVAAAAPSWVVDLPVLAIVFLSASQVLLLARRWRSHAADLILNLSGGVLALIGWILAAFGFFPAFGLVLVLGGLVVVLVQLVCRRALADHAWILGRPPYRWNLLLAAVIATASSAGPTLGLLTLFGYGEYRLRGIHTLLEPQAGTCPYLAEDEARSSADRWSLVLLDEARELSMAQALADCVLASVPLAQPVVAQLEKAPDGTSGGPLTDSERNRRLWADRITRGHGAATLATPLADSMNTSAYRRYVETLQQGLEESPLNSEPLPAASNPYLVAELFQLSQSGGSPQTTIDALGRWASKDKLLFEGLQPLAFMAEPAFYTADIEAEPRLSSLQALRRLAPYTEASVDHTYDGDTTTTHDLMLLGLSSRDGRQVPERLMVLRMVPASEVTPSDGSPQQGNEAWLLSYHETEPEQIMALLRDTWSVQPKLIGQGECPGGKKTPKNLHLLHSSEEGHVMLSVGKERKAKGKPTMLHLLYSPSDPCSESSWGQR